MGRVLAIEIASLFHVLGVWQVVDRECFLPGQTLLILYRSEVLVRLPTPGI